MCFATAPTETLSLRRAFTLGILSGLLFWMKQNDIGLPLALVAYLLIEFLFRGARRVRVESLVAMSAGALLVYGHCSFAFLRCRARWHSSGMLHSFSTCLYRRDVD